MQAVVIRGSSPPSLVIDEVADPVRGVDQTLVRLEACASNPGELRAMGARTDGSSIGWDVAGRVIETDDDGHGLVVGERVVGTGPPRRRTGFDPTRRALRNLPRGAGAHPRIRNPEDRRKTLVQKSGSGDHRQRRQMTYGKVFHRSMRHLRTRALAPGAVIGIAAIAPVLADGEASPDEAAATQASAGGAALFAPIAEVIWHPRCVNCHTTTDFPRQNDDRRRHQFHVVRGPDDHGASGLKCATCDGEQNNDVGGVPGAPHWTGRCQTSWTT